jgi:hypothetical protein
MPDASEEPEPPLKRKKSDEKEKEVIEKKENDSDEETSLQFSSSSHRDSNDDDGASMTESDDDNIAEEPAGNRHVLDDSSRESFKTKSSEGSSSSSSDARSASPEVPKLPDTVYPTHVAFKTLRPNHPEDPGDDDDDDDDDYGSKISDEGISSSEGNDDDDDKDPEDTLRNDDPEDTSPNDDGSDDNDLHVDMYDALTAYKKHGQELAEQDSDGGSSSEGDSTPEANKGVTKPTPGVPEAAAIPKLLADIVWPKHRAQSGGKRQFRSLPLQRDTLPAREADPDFTAKASTKPRVKRIRRKAFLAGKTSYGYVPPKVKIRSILSSQRDIVTLFNNLDRQEEEKKVRTIDYRDHVLDTIGSDVRKTLSKDEMIAVRVNRRNRKVELKAERKERIEEAEEAENDFLTEYYPIQKKKGVTNARKQEAILNRKFPPADGQMTEAERLDYKAFKSECTSQAKDALEATDKLMMQVCTLQYMPRDRTPIFPDYPHGKVAYVNAKVRSKKKGRVVETMVSPPVTVQWVKYCFNPEYVRL